MKKHALKPWSLEGWGQMDWRALQGARPSGISYLLSNGRSGTIIDPQALRVFYTRLYYAKKTNIESPRGRQDTRRPPSKT